MDTQFDDMALFFLSSITFKYRTSVYRASTFDNKVSREDLENMMNKIYQNVNDFKALQAVVLARKKYPMANWLLLLSALFFIIVILVDFASVWLLIFLGIFFLSGSYYAWIYYKETSNLRIMKKYEEKIIEVLFKINQEVLNPKGLKLTILREYIILVLHAEYKRAEWKFKLVYGDRNIDELLNARKPTKKENNLRNYQRQQMQRVAALNNSSRIDSQNAISIGANSLTPQNIPGNSVSAEEQTGLNTNPPRNGETELVPVRPAPEIFNPVQAPLQGIGIALPSKPDLEKNVNSGLIYVAIDSEEEI